MELSNFVSYRDIKRQDGDLRPQKSAINQNNNCALERVRQNTNHGCYGKILDFEFDRLLRKAYRISEFLCSSPLSFIVFSNSPFLISQKQSLP